MAPADCPGADTDGQTRACTGGVCGFAYQPAGTLDVPCDDPEVGVRVVRVGIAQ
jgi:hypothetical protein